jgi:hypothetical protein
MTKRNGPSAGDELGPFPPQECRVSQPARFRTWVRNPQIPTKFGFKSQQWPVFAGRNSDAKLRASPRCDARLQQIKLSNQLAGGLVGEPAGAGNTVDFGPFGTKPGQTQPPLDLINLFCQ